MPYWSIFCLYCQGYLADALLECLPTATRMWNNRPLMKLSRDEEVFLRHWMYDEVHYRDGQGPAKRLQLEPF